MAPHQINNLPSFINIEYNLNTYNFFFYYFDGMNNSAIPIPINNKIILIINITK